MAVRVRVAALVWHRGRVLLVSTKKGAPGHLVPPGGGLKQGETVQEAAVREVREETGLAVAVGGLVAYRELCHGGRISLELYVSARLRPASEHAAAADGENRQVRWVRPEELADTPHFPAGLAGLCRLARGRSGGALYMGRVEY